MHHGLYRFVDKIEKVAGCWEWQGPLIRGYGRLLFRGKPWLAHRVSYALFVAEIPNDLLVCHKCDNRRCVNPKHLFLGSAQDNVDDMISKGRACDSRGERNANAKLSPADVVAIKSAYKKGTLQKVLAKKFGVTQVCISQVVTGRHWNRG